jgi:hypothetical protein
MKTVIFERIQICEFVYSEVDITKWMEENPDSNEESYIEHIRDLVRDEDNAWSANEVLIVGRIESTGK